MVHPNYFHASHHGWSHDETYDTNLVPILGFDCRSTYRRFNRRNSPHPRRSENVAKEATEETSHGTRSFFGCICERTEVTSGPVQRTHRDETYTTRKRLPNFLRHKTSTSSQHHHDPPTYETTTRHIMLFGCDEKLEER